MLLIPIAAFSLQMPPLPQATRDILLDRSRSLNPSSPYAKAGWSNRAATVLTPVDASGIYTADRPFLWNNIDVGCRATIVELEDKKLWVHSPVGLDGPLLQSLQQLGEVAYVVTPNYEHTKFAASWYQNYDSVVMVGCPGVSERVPQVEWTCEIPFGYRPPQFRGLSKPETFPASAWDPSLIETMHIDVEKNPFTGQPFFNEVIFFHQPSKALLTTDLFWNYPKSGIPNDEFGRNDAWDLAPVIDEVPFGSRAWKFGMDKVYYPFYNNLMVTDKQEYRHLANHIVNVWQPELVVPAHGDVLRGKSFIRDVLSRFFHLN